jgi:hypothetical protein
MPKRKSTIRKTSKAKKARAKPIVNEPKKIATQETQKEPETDEKSCTICFELLEEKQFLPCTHVFHPKCIATWLEYSNNCPLCRHPIRDEPIDNDWDNIAQAFIYNMTFPEFFAIYVELAEI